MTAQNTIDYTVKISDTQVVEFEAARVAYNREIEEIREKYAKIFNNILSLKEK